MRHNPIITALALASLVPFISASGCKKEEPASVPAQADDAAHDHDHDHDHDHATSEAGHGGPVIALGEQPIGAFVAKATRDEGQIVAGKDAPIDVTITPAPGSSGSIAAVRFWIGTQDAKGSVKAKAAVENAADPDRWHVHAEIPNPLPEGSMLWVEIEDDKGAISSGSFDLRM